MAKDKSAAERVLKMNDLRYQENNRRRIERLLREPKVTVYGNPLYKEFLGDVFTYTFQDYPVSIAFDGKNHLFPRTIAKNLLKKLEAASHSNVPIRTSETVVY